MKKLRLKRGQERKILDGNLWVFSNQVEDPLRNYQPGELVRVTDRAGDLLGIGYVNPKSLIAARLLTRDEQTIDVDFFEQRFAQAHAMRVRALPEEEGVREVFSESDWLPGLIVDRYRDVLVVQIGTAGMDRQRDAISAALQRVFKPRAIYERSDIAVRALEGLENKTGLIYGKLNDEPVQLVYGSITVPIDVKRGQKTGIYLDQRINLQFIDDLAKGARVLDVFCYMGIWGLKCARFGAAQVMMLDDSEWAVEMAMHTARRSRLGSRCQALRADAFEALKQMAREKESYDLVILDPPSFIKSKQHFKQGYKGYFDLNQRALGVLQPGGFLVTCSCSHHLDRLTFAELIQNVLRSNGRQGRILFEGGQGPDHPVLPTMPETEYLHCLVLQVF